MLLYMVIITSLDHQLLHEHASILAIALSLNQLEVDYAHPEVGVVTSDDDIVYGDNYFTLYGCIYYSRPIDIDGCNS